MNQFRGSKNGSSYLRVGNRIAGDGIISDNYSEESGNPKYEKFKFGDGRVKFSTDKYDPKSLNGPVIIVQEGKKKHD